jgi:hypothetical protein
MLVISLKDEQLLRFSFYFGVPRLAAFEDK